MSIQEKRKYSLYFFVDIKKETDRYCFVGGLAKLFTEAKVNIEHMNTKNFVAKISLIFSIFYTKNMFQVKIKNTPLPASLSLGRSASSIPNGYS